MPVYSCLPLQQEDIKGPEATAFATQVGSSGVVVASDLKDAAKAARADAERVGDANIATSFLASRTCHPCGKCRQARGAQHGGEQEQPWC